MAASRKSSLRHLGGDLYAVVATWNHTEIERAVLFERVNEGGDVGNVASVQVRYAPGQEP